ncbi:glycoside hydrolase family 16 protein [Geodermatophilus sp. SYSU D01036]
MAGVLTGQVLASGEEITGTPPAPVGPAGPWTFAWGDEFDGDSLDLEVWQPNRYGTDTGDPPFVPDSEAAWFSPSSVRVVDGQLVLRVEEDERRLEGRTYPYRSGVVQATQPQHEVAPGTYVEARIRVPQCDGCWPAFWLVAPDRWPPEIDVFEFFGTESDRRPSFNHYPEGYPDDADKSGPAPYGEQEVDYRNGLHVYGLLWDGSQAVPYVDGKAYPEVAARDVTSLPLMLILNLSVQDGHEPAVGSEMRVDWVRVWRPAAR